MLPGCLVFYKMSGLLIRIGLLATLSTLSPAFCTSIWSTAPASKEAQPYEVWVKAWFSQGHYTNCGGVILNDRYVLTIYRCAISVSKTAISTSKNIRIIVNYVNSIIPKNRKDQSELEYEIEEVWPSNYDEYFSPLHFFALLRTKQPIEFNTNVKCIQLPTEQSAWKSPSGIPNDEEFTSSFWCKGEKNYQLFLKKGIRNCSDSIRLHTPRWLIPSCLEDNRKDLKCFWPFGSPLFYKGILVGMRNYEGKSPSPIAGVNYDFFINVAQYTHLIEEHMRDYTPCMSDPKEN